MIAPKSFNFHENALLEIVKTLVVVILCTISSFSCVKAQKIYFFAEAGKDFTSSPLTNVYILDGDNLYAYGVSSHVINRLRDNINYYEELYSYEGYVETYAAEHFKYKFVLNKSKSDGRFDYYEGRSPQNWNNIVRISKDKSEERRGIYGNWRFVRIDKNEILKSYDNGSIINSNGNINNTNSNNQGSSYQGNNGYQSNSPYNNRGNSTNGRTTTQPLRQFKCAYCNGTGRIERNDNAPASFGQARVNKKCSECGKIYDPTVFNHYHQQCRHCGGTGYAK